MNRKFKSIGPLLLLVFFSPFPSLSPTLPHFLSRWIIYWRWQSPLNFKLLVHFSSWQTQNMSMMKKWLLQLNSLYETERPFQQLQQDSEWVRVWDEERKKYPKPDLFIDGLFAQNLYMDFEFISFYLNYFVGLFIRSFVRLQQQSMGRIRQKCSFGFTKVFARFSLPLSLFLATSADLFLTIFLFLRLRSHSIRKEFVFYWDSVKLYSIVNNVDNMNIYQGKMSGGGSTREVSATTKMKFSHFSSLECECTKLCGLKKKKRTKRREKTTAPNRFD